MHEFADKKTFYESIKIIESVANQLRVHSICLKYYNYCAVVYTKAYNLSYDSDFCM